MCSQVPYSNVINKTRKLQLWPGRGLAAEILPSGPPKPREGAQETAVHTLEKGRSLVTLSKNLPSASFLSHDKPRNGKATARKTLLQRTAPAIRTYVVQAIGDDTGSVTRGHNTRVPSRLGTILPNVGQLRASPDPPCVELPSVTVLSALFLQSH